MLQFMTERIFLAPLTWTDYLEAGKFIHTEEYRQFDEPSRPIPSQEDEKRFWVNCIESNLYFIRGIRLLSDHSLVGSINAFDFNESDQSCESGINIFPPVNFGKGYAFDAYRLFLPLLKESKNIKTVNILTHPLNERARKLYLKLGFVQLGFIPDENVTWVKMSYAMK
jgi:RimJ/RimL family protein N-acetyltransferase